MPDDLEFQIAKLALGPNDILAIKPDRILTSVSAAELAARIGHRHGLQGRVMILDPGTELAVVSRSDVETKATPAVEAGAPVIGTAPKSRATSGRG